MMHFEQSGTGERIFVALHGWGGNHLTYAPIVPFLPATISLYAGDLPGYGRSRPINADSAVELAATISDEIARLPGSSLTLVGNCSGAIFACLAAQMLGRRVDRLVLVDPFAFVPWYFRVFITRPIGPYAYYSTFANPIGRWLTNASLKNRRAAETHLTDSFREVDHEVALGQLAMLAALGSIDRFRSLNMPVDVLYGERTFEAVKRSLAGWRRVLPQAELWKIGGAGHLPIEEAPREVASIVFKRRRWTGTQA